MDKNDKLLHIVSYVTWLSTKQILAQKLSKEGSQASMEPEVNIEPDISKNQLNIKDSYEQIINGDLSMGLKNEMLEIHPPSSKKRTSFKRKRDARKSGDAK